MYGGVHENQGEGTEVLEGVEDKVDGQWDQDILGDSDTDNESRWYGPSSDLAVLFEHNKADDQTGQVTTPFSDTMAEDASFPRWGWSDGETHMQHRQLGTLAPWDPRRVSMVTDMNYSGEAFLGFGALDDGLLACEGPGPESGDITRSSSGTPDTKSSATLILNNVDPATTKEIIGSVLKHVGDLTIRTIQE